MMVRLPMLGGSKRARSVTVSVARTINLVIELDPADKYGGAFYGRPGLATWRSTPTTEGRGCIVYHDALYTVMDSTLWMDDGSTITAVGTLLTSTGRVGMAANTSQIMIVDGTYGYIWDGSSLARITDGDFPNGATHVQFLDGYFVVNDPANDGRFNISNFENGNAWTATDYGTAVRCPDPLEAIIVADRNLWLIGSNSTEVWYNNGDPDFPFAPIDSQFSEWGTGAPYSAAVVASSDGGAFPVWLAQNSEGDDIVLAAGKRVSDHNLETVIAGYETTSDAFTYVVSMQGHTFVVLNFPTDEATWVLDLSNGQWAEWRSYGSNGFLGACHALFQGEHVIVGQSDGNIYHLSWDQYTDAGQPIECIRQFTCVSNNRQMVSHNSFELEAEFGQGTASTNPQATLRWSDDGGHTFGNGHARSLGLLGHYKNRARWLRLGSSIDRVYQLVHTDPCKVAWLASWLDAA